MNVYLRWDGMRATEANMRAAEVKHLLNKWKLETSAIAVMKNFTLDGEYVFAASPRQSLNGKVSVLSRVVCEAMEDGPLPLSLFSSLSRGK